MLTKELLIPDIVEKTVSEFKTFVEQKKTLKCVFETVAGNLPEQIQVTDDYKIHLPPSYLAFIKKFGYLSVKSRSSGQTGIISFFEPSSLIGLCASPEFKNPSWNAIGFQRILNDNVENYYCFNHLVDLGNGEFEIVRYFHDEKFVLKKDSNPSSVNFYQHIVWVLREFMDLYQNED